MLLNHFFGGKNIQNHHLDSVVKDAPILLEESESTKILRVGEIIKEESR